MLSKVQMDISWKGQVLFRKSPSDHANTAVKKLKRQRQDAFLVWPYSANQLIGNSRTTAFQQPSMSKDRFPSPEGRLKAGWITQNIA